MREKLPSLRWLWSHTGMCGASVMEADASRYHGVAGNEPIDWSDPAINTRAVREYLAALDPTPDKSRTTPKVVSLSDPCSAWTAKANKRVLFGYGLNYLIDNEHVLPGRNRRTAAPASSAAPSLRASPNLDSRKNGITFGRPPQSTLSTVSTQSRHQLRR